MQQYQERCFRQKLPYNVHHRENDGDGRHRQTPVELVGTTLRLLPLSFDHIKECQADHRTDAATLPTGCDS